jgi:hypothetical protein
MGRILCGAIAEHRGLQMTMMVLGGGLVVAAIGAIAIGTSEDANDSHAQTRPSRHVS